eukprot:c11259_g1_i2.p1 GENE.c11259_g1_i2~~c11259_g1_i2.p1  ORF type:complete len:454 (+),score=138.32 c11259_g1_i2:42-1403(+)
MLVDNEAISNLLGLFPKAASGGMTTILWVLLVVVVVGLVSLCLFVFFCLRRSKGYDVELPTRKPRKRRAIDEPLIDTSPDQFASTSRRSIIKVTDDPTELADDGGDIKARMFLRSSNRFVVKSYLSNIGTRQGKSFTLVLDKELKSSDPLLMAQVTLGDLCPISFQQPSNMVTFTAMLTKIQHPYVMPVHHVEYVPDRSVVLVFRRFIKEGSLRDYIHKKNPKDSWDRKYAASSTSLPYTTIQRFGRQILEGVRFFRLKDWTLPHLHTANVLVQNGVCRITDYENGVLCVVPRWRTKLAPLLGTVDPEVVAFGHVLWEMAVGSEYNGTSDVPTAVPSHVATTVAEILSRIFMIGHASAMSFDELVDHPFFAVAGVDIPDQKLVKFDSVMKSMIKSASQVMLSTIPLVTESTPSSSLALQVVADDETGAVICWIFVNVSLSCDMLCMVCAVCGL